MRRLGVDSSSVVGRALRRGGMYPPYPTLFGPANAWLGRAPLLTSIVIRSYAKRLRVLRFIWAVSENFSVFGLYEQKAEYACTMKLYPAACTLLDFGTSSRTQKKPPECGGRRRDFLHYFPGSMRWKTLSRLISRCLNAARMWITTRTINSVAVTP